MFHNNVIIFTFICNLVFCHICNSGSDCSIWNVKIYSSCFVFVGLMHKIFHIHETNDESDSTLLSFLIKFSTSDAIQPSGSNSVVLFTSAGPLVPDGHGVSRDWWFNLDLTNWVPLLASLSVGCSGFKARPGVSCCPDASIILRCLHRSGVRLEVAFNAQWAVSCATALFYSMTLNCRARQMVF